MLPTKTQGTPHLDIYKKIAQAVVALILPTITMAVDAAVSAGMDQLHKEIGKQARRMTETECPISTLEDEVYQNNGTLQQHSQIHAIIQEKLEDLENRS